MYRDAESVLSSWHDRTGEYSPRYYAYYGADERSEAIRRVLEGSDASDPTVLELGYSSGRHLAHLYEAGYRDLWGIDVNEEAFPVMAETYPDLAAAGTFFADPIETVITGFDDRQFDLVFSVETLQHIHADNRWVFDEIVRITGERLVTVEVESAVGGPEEGSGVTYVDDEFPLYFRDWGATFEDRGLVALDTRHLDRDTFRVFGPEDD